MSLIHIIGILLTVGLLLAVSILSGRKVRDERSFTTGGRSGSWMVCGAILGTLVGGQSTIGTAQLAFSFGLSAWWFTLGAALGALLLALVYAGPVRRSGCSTLLEIVARQYGRKAETVGSLLFLIGIFISIMAQVLSSTAMVTSLFHLPQLGAALISAALITLMVLFGGIQSAGAGGIIKLVLLYVSCITAGVAALRLAGGWDGLLGDVQQMYAGTALSEVHELPDAEAVHRRYGNLVARGPLKDIGGCLSLALGVVTTQTYAQGILSGATTRKARRGALLCAFFIPFIGAACTLMGLYMRGHYVTADEAAALQAAGEVLPAGIGMLQSSAEAFPVFVVNCLPPWLGGIAIGAMLVNVMGCCSGLSLGAATILVRDVYGNLGAKLDLRPARISKLALTRLSIVGILAVAVAAALLSHGAYINDLGFLSLGLRAVALLFPLTFALFLPGRFGSRFAVPAMVAGTAGMLLAKFLGLPADPLYYGLAASAATMLLGRKPTRK